MPVKIDSFEPLSEEEFATLQQRNKTRKANPVLAELLDRVEAGQPMRVPLVDGQSARGLRTAISRAATSRGLTVETVEGDGFVAVRQAEETRTRRDKSAPAGSGQRRRGRPRKREEQVQADVASLEDLAAGET